MGRPSQKWYSAQRPGKSERARVKKPRRSQAFGTVAGAGTYALKAGRKKWSEFFRSKKNPFGYFQRNRSDFDAQILRNTGPSIGEPISKAGTVSGDGQPVSTAECNSRPAESHSSPEDHAH